MFRKFALMAAFLGLQAGLLFGISGVASASPHLSGNVTCSTSGGGTLNPGLTSTGSGSGVKITYTGKVFGCAGGSITIGSVVHTVVSGIMKVNDWYFTGTAANSCSSFEGSSPVDAVGKIKMTVKWTLSPPLTVAPSKVTYHAGAYAAPVTGTTMALELGAVPGTPKTVTGSYAGSLVQDTLMNVTVPAGGCPVGPSFSFPTGTVKF
jgi:hypothetical protein